MIPNNPFKDAQGKVIQQFKAEARAWDMCLDSIKQEGFYLRHSFWYNNMPSVVNKLRPKQQPGWLVFIQVVA